jgi:hypothetical protein
VKGKLANGVGSQYPSHYLGTYVPNITTADAHTSAASSRLNWLPPADLNGLVRAERRNLVSARLPSHFKRSLQTGHNRQWLFEFDGIKYCKQFFCETTIYGVGLLAACAFCSPFYFYSIQWWVLFNFNIILWLRSISLPSARRALHKSLIPLCNNEEPEVGCRMVGYKIVLAFASYDRLLLF